MILNLLITWVVTALAFFIAAKALKGMKIQGGVGTYFVLAFVYGALMVMIGWCLTGVLHLATLGFFLLTGLSAVIRLVVMTLVLAATDKLSKRLSIDGLGTAFFAAVIMALVGFAADFVIGRLL
ncbi:MAG: hypothetical protein CMN30_26295 [Sandaracinus sp.]|nr:hypothetical protein [Sandaracinus sp.]|tara:strand:- start:595 stop:966 length:372 start_codon:yes stop_codon:yes gene_type:complete